MHLTRPAVALALVGAVVLATGAGASPPDTLRLTDVGGDANGVNSQSLPKATFGNLVGPAQRPEADVLSLTFTPTRVAGRCTGFRTTIELAAPAGEHLTYRIEAVGPDDEVLWLEYDAHALGRETTFRIDTGGRAKFLPITPAKVVGNRIVLTVTETELKAVTGGRPDRFGVYRVGIVVRTSVAGKVTAPVWDAIDQDETKSFTPCR